MKIRVLAAAATALLSAGCGDSTNQQPDDGIGQPVANASPVTPLLVGEPTVVSLPYGLPDEVGFDTSVVFTLTNPSDKPLAAATYQYELFDKAGTSLGTSGPRNVPLAAKETRLVVDGELDPSVPGDLDDRSTVTTRSPRTAKVSVFAAVPTGAPVEPITRWQANNLKINCNTGVVGCSVTGTVTWTGDKSVGQPFLMVVVRSSAQGPVVAAGTNPAEVANFPPNAPQPFSINVLGVKTAPKSPTIEVIAQLSPAG
ncbi:hypothetical protein AB0H83_36680 [Dactylosporangium sp. NPDC050688]|uniref:hypothetical protein n=1 Tax=Dactylosporangium sp. NPDC050688 TaxID=3157217 RepID=UPI0033F40A8A